jgi:hypothetical protein
MVLESEKPFQIERSFPFTNGYTFRKEKFAERSVWLLSEASENLKYRHL